MDKLPFSVYLALVVCVVTKKMESSHNVYFWKVLDLDLVAVVIQVLVRVNTNILTTLTINLHLPNLSLK